MSLNELKSYLDETASNPISSESFNNEIAKREAEGLTKEEATYQAGYQAYCCFNYFANECEALERELDALRNKGVYKWHGGLRASS